MSITVGSTLPPATLLKIGGNGPETIALTDKLVDRKVVISVCLAHILAPVPLPMCRALFALRQNLIKKVWTRSSASL